MAIVKASWVLLLLVTTFDYVSAQCDETLRSPAGLIQSPGYPGDYPSRMDYIWCVDVQGATGIDITLLGEFALEINEDNDGTTTCKDMLEIGQGIVPFQDTIGVFCGNSTPPAQRVGTNQMWVNLFTDRNVEMSGFQLIYRSELDVCYSSPCTNGGTCMSDLITYTYTCHCSPGWQGTRCEIDVDECASDPCQNNGTCTHQVGVDFYICSCAPGFTGVNCEIDIDDCQNVTCEHQGSCVDLVNDFVCNCSAGWEGQFCQDDVDECASDPCQNNGTCTHQVGVDFYNCSCAPGFFGVNCEISGVDCKVSDFGISREGEVCERRANVRLPIRWMASKSLFHRLCTVKSDMWSFGVLLWEIVTLGATPYPGMTSRQVMGYVKHGYRMEKPPHCDDKIYKIMAACWEEDPTERPSFQDLERAMETLIEEEYINLANFNEAIYANPQTSTEEKC